MENDICEVLLGLFVPWEETSKVYLQHCSDITQTTVTYHKLWLEFWQHLNSHLQFFSENVHLLWKSHKNTQLDTKLRQSFQGEVESGMGNDVIEETLTENVDVDEVHDVDEVNVPVESLLAAYQIVLSKWAQKAQGSQIPLGETGAAENWQQFQTLSQLNTIDIMSSDIMETDQETLQDWKTILKSHMKHNPSQALHRDANDSDASDNEGLDFRDGILIPEVNMILSSEVLPFQAGEVDSPSISERILEVVTKSTPLNEKQWLVVQRVLRKIVECEENPYDPNVQDQILLYVGGEGGVGKSQIVKGVHNGMKLLQHQHEIIVMAPTGAAADNIGGNTYHTLLGLGCQREEAFSQSP